MAVTHASLNGRAEARELRPFESWPGGASPAGYVRRPLDDEASRFFDEQGFLVVENALSSDEVDELRREAVAICRGERGDLPGTDPGPAGESDDEAMRRILCIHFPHKVSPVMERQLAHPAIVETLTTVIGPNVKCMQSMLFIKSAGKPGQAWHQDEIYIPTRDRSLTGGWIAMDDATVENGCLWVIPGSHRPGVLYYQEWHADPRFDCAFEARRYPWTDADAVPVEVRAGSIVFFNGYLLHRSLPNYANAGYRRALVNHYMSAASLLPWYGGTLPEGQHVSIADHRDIVMIAGEDPYAWKGTEQRHGPHVRPSGEGGCGNLKYNEEALTRLSEQGGHSSNRER
ncbi:MAG: phytanoyl-CoA dioxygenase family protein [Fimbriimonadaceae bacterium]|nr:phytanoyl-CoA dioxygenase family protein [Fimbriimonadaceae bacterium]